MVLNDFYADARELQKTSGRTQAEICELAGVGAHNFFNVCRYSGIVAPTFAKLIEAAGYDIELTYIPRDNVR